MSTRNVAMVRGSRGEHYAEVSAEVDPYRLNLIHLYVDDPTLPNEPATVTVDLTVEAARRLANHLIQAIAEQLEREHLEREDIQ